MVIERRGSRRANITPITADVAGAMNPDNPFSRPLFNWKTLRTKLGAIPPDRPESIQTTAITGAAAVNSLRVVGGMATRGTRDSSAPGTGVELSGDMATTMIPRIVMMARTVKTMA